MKSNSDPSGRLARALKALNESTSLFDQSRTSNSPEDSFAPLGEALSWITVIDNYCIEIDGPAYREACRSSEFGLMVLGLRYIRNLLTHNSKTADLVGVVSGAQYPVRPPVCPFELIWKVRADLPAPDRRNQELDEAYSQHVQGRMARETLRAAEQFFLSRLNGK